ncbi:WD repeat-containing protein 89-like [Lytechinus pictus]|uniref:WD repeat-containing protein 89-like n=1 Tax=Lytechinus pictus TaxID=7653 RepID=UPI0030BA1AE9
MVCSDHTIKLVGKDSMSSRGQLTGHSGPVSGVSFAHRNPFTVFSSSRDGTVRCWDTRMKRNKAPQVFTGYEGNSFTSFDINSTDDILSAGTEAVDNDAYLMFCPGCCPVSDDYLKPIPRGEHRAAEHPKSPIKLDSLKVSQFPI